MSLEGVVQNGTIVLQTGTALPEGMRVTIVPDTQREGNEPIGDWHESH